jgi:hypothetical protein
VDPLEQAAPPPLQNCTGFAACPFLPTPRRGIFEPPRLNENRIYGIEAGRRHQAGPVVCLDRNQKLHLRQLAAAPAANLQQKLAERLYCALASAKDAS